MRGILWSPAPCLLIVALAGSPLAGQSPDSAGPPPHAIALAQIGRSGLRALLSASGNIGDLQNRAGSYRMAVQLERSRVGPLEGRLSALDRALAAPDLPGEERAAITGLREATLAELEAVPRYEAGYRTGTAQLELLKPFGFLGSRPIFLLVRGRGHLRGGGEDGLTVYSEGGSVAPVLMASDRWIVAPGLGLGRTDVGIGRFDGSSGTTSVGPQLNVGGILGEGWSVAVQLGHSWSRGESRIVRPGPDGPVEVRSEGWSRGSSAKAEVKGRLSVPGLPASLVAVRPRIGAYLVSTYSPATTNSLGETGTGPFGERESLAAARAGASLDVALGAWSPTLYVGWERELTDELSTLVRDPQALLAGAGVSWTWSRGRRVSLDYMRVRGFEDLRRVSELTLVVILDG